MKKIYVCSQYRGDTVTNVQNAKDYCAYIVKECGATRNTDDVFLYADGRAEAAAPVQKLHKGIHCKQTECRILQSPVQESV